jgi:uncharacterized membrane protein (DUF485 family)
MQNATSVPHVDRADEAAATRLDLRLRRQRVLAWSMTAGTVLITATFFALLSRNNPLLRHIVYGHTVTVADLVAVAIILVMLVSVAVFGWYAQRIDADLQRRGRDA